MERNDWLLPSDNLNTSNIPTSSKQNRIRFPNEFNSLRRPLDGSAKSFASTYNSSPMRRGSPLNPQKASLDARRHSRTLEAQDTTNVVDSPRQRRALLPDHETVYPDGKDSKGLPQEHTLENNMFSDEYDLSHEDPRIIQSVQHALKMKARREARLKQDHIASVDTPNVTPPSHLTISQSRKLQFPLSPPASPTPSRQLGNSTSSEIDFSPSTGATIPLNSHPVPSSPNNGMTLDWTGSVPDEEKIDKRWMPSRGKWKEKDKIVPLGVMVDQQEQFHKEKLRRIKSVASPQTLQKASITSQQLERRYNLIYPSSTSKPLSMTQVARWYGSQDKEVKEALEKAEPLTWIKHLDRRTRKPTRLPWHLSALIMEQYLQTRVHQDGMETVPEHAALQMPSPDMPSKSYQLDSSSQAGSYVHSERVGLSGSSGTTSAASLLASASPLRMNASNDLPKRMSEGQGSSEPTSFVERSNIVLNHIAVSRDDDDNGIVISQPEIKIVVAQELSDYNSDSLNFAVSPSGRSDPSGRSPAHSTHSVPHSSNPRAVGVPLLSKVSNAKSRSSRANEELARKKYDAKTTLLEQTSLHNNRIRQLLNRISTGVKEYEAIQSNAFQSLGVSYEGLPKELLEAFSHDPAAVVGATRRLRGWRAVDDIHFRLIRQRQVFQAYLSHPVKNTKPQSVLGNPISALTKILGILESHQETVAARIKEVTELLKSVDELHGVVKLEYNDTLSHTSVAYPELSHIIALEETYRDQYQQFWEFGMDALTFLLDTVTPFWRTYGKRIGEDVCDFLIIPLYRNEFTGEAKRYRIKELPKRSPRHWTGLFLFFLTSIGINILQLRAAISSSLHWQLRWIPYDGVRYTALPFFSLGILLQWVAVVLEFVVVFMQMSVVTWWTGWYVKIFT